MRMGLLRAAAAIAASLATICLSQAQTLRPVSIGVSSSSLVAASPRIAREMGLFEKRGLEPRLIVMASANAAMQALVSRSVDLALAGPGEILAAQSRGQRLVVLGTAYRGLGASLVLAKSAAEASGARPASPLAERLKAIDGLAIGSANATSSYTLSFKGAAAAVGATPRFVYLDAAGMAAALDSGALQGFIASAPFWASPIFKGTGVLWVSGPKGELPAEHSPASSLSIAALRESAEANRRLFDDVVAVMADFAKAIDERPDDVKAATARLFPALDPQTLDLLFTMESPSWKLEKLTVADIAQEIAFLKSSGANLPELERVDPAALLPP